MSRDDDLFNEWAAESLMDGDDQLAWERSRNEALGHQPGWCSDNEQREHLATDRAAVMAQYDPRHFRWWDSRDDL